MGVDLLVWAGPGSRPGGTLGWVAVRNARKSPSNSKQLERPECPCRGGPELVQHEGPVPGFRGWIGVIYCGVDKLHPRRWIPRRFRSPKRPNWSAIGLIRNLKSMRWSRGCATIAWG